KGMAEASVQLVSRLEQHRDLFRKGPESDALTLALMRTATRIGSPESTLRYAEMVLPNSAIRLNPEYNWLAGAARLQLTDYAGAETFFTNILNSPSADLRHKLFAANGLIGVYDKLHRSV